jgi:hypothetical protein
VAADLPIELPHPRNQITTRALPQYLDYRGGCWRSSSPTKG